MVITITVDSLYNCAVGIKEKYQYSQYKLSLFGTCWDNEVTSQ